MAIRNKKLQQILENATSELAIADNSDEEEMIFTELEENAAIFVGLRYSFRGTVPKNFYWYDEVLPNLDHMRFKMLIRCSRQQFNVILSLIENHTVFNGINSNKQFTVQFQLALVLYRLGSSGDGGTVGKIASLFGVGDGGTINKITSRVFKSILSIEDKFVYWPNKDERIELVVETFHELPHCIGYVDGTEIPLKERPTLDHSSYYSKSQQYSLKVQVVGDCHLKIRQIIVGYPGCAHDARIYNNSKLSTQPENYFSDEQYIIADSAYKLTTTTISSFRQNSTDLTAKQRTAFNKYFNCYRVRIEHIFGILKEKLPSLKSLNLHISDVNSHRAACTWIRVCCILYNILLPHFDCDDFAPTSYENTITEDPENEVENVFNVNNDESGKAKRIALSEVIREM